MSADEYELSTIRDAIESARILRLPSARDAAESRLGFLTDAQWDEIKSDWERLWNEPSAGRP
jgi:hypothetical protein